MDKIFNYPINSLKNLTKSLKKKSLLIDKPWALVDDNGQIQKFIFYVKKSKISSIKSLLVIKSANSITYEIENGVTEKRFNTKRKITVNGNPIEKRSGFRKWCVLCKQQHNTRYQIYKIL